MSQLGVQIDKRRVKEASDTVLTSPHGTVITVTKSRAAVLLARPAVRFGDGSARVYALGEDADNTAPEPTTTKTMPPRKGDGRNSSSEG